jgi:hypothetical protein
MLSFLQYLKEDKNLHMTHLEDLVLMYGVKGARESINYLRDLRDMLSGSTSKPIKATIKWDGAPALTCGKDPSDGKFFVGKKSVFNKTPKLYKSIAEINDDKGLSGDLAEKFKIAFEELSKMNINGVYQGDFMFIKSDLKKETINGEKCVTFHPNTIVYSVPVNTELASSIMNSRVGIVFHTRYIGNDFADMKAVFGENITNNFSKNSKVWAIDATYEDISGSANFTKQETAEITKILSDAGKLFQKLDSRLVNGISEVENLRIRVMTFWNSKIRIGEEIKNTKTFTKDLIQNINAFYDKEIEKKSSPAGKKTALTKKEEVLKYFVDNDINEIEKIFILMNLLIRAKKLVIDKMNSASQLTTLIRTKKGFEVTNHEGFVAINREGKVVKLVDRLVFARANWNPDVIKGWDSITRS